MAQRWYRLFRTTYDRTFGRHLLLANTVSCGALMGVGDLAVQSIENLSDPKPHDWARTGRMCSMGVILGPFNHYWYTFLDRVLPGRTTKVVVKKILMDQVIASPFFAFSFFMGMGTMEGQPVNMSWKEFKGKFWTVYKADWSVWPAAQAINFYFLPTQLRVVYVAMVTFGWNTFLSYMKHKDQAQRQKVMELIKEKEQTSSILHSTSRNKDNL